jgi:hypothetical protein
MAEPVAGASAILNLPPTATPAPPEGMTPEQGWAKRSELRSNPDFLERVRAGDTAAMGELRDAEKAIQGGIQIHAGVGVDPRSLGDKATEAANAAAALDMENYIDSLRRTVDVPEDVAAMIRNRTPTTRREKHEAQLLRQRLRSDRALQERRMAGDRAARSQEFLIDVILGAPNAD